MKISPLDRLHAQEDLRDTRADSRLCYACVPLLVRNDFDVDTQSGNDLSEGNGLGAVDAQWRIYGLRVHFRNVDTALMTFGHVPPGVVLGDLLINFGPRDLAAINQVMGNDDAYLLVDGDTFHIISILPSGLGQIEEWAADARRFSPNYRAAGY